MVLSAVENGRQRKAGGGGQGKGRGVGTEVLFPPGGQRRPLVR